MSGDLQRNKSFITKVKNLCKKIKKSTDLQIETQVHTCQEILNDLFQDNIMLSCLKNERLTLVAYEMILYSFQNFGAQKQSYQNIDHLFHNNRLINYLVSIKDMLSSMQQFFKTNQQRLISTSYPKKQQKISSTQSLIQRFSGGISKVVDLIQQFKSKTQLNERDNSLFTYKIEKTSKQIYAKQKQMESENEILLEQMQQILLKKQKKINQLTILLKQKQQQQSQIFDNQLQQLSIRYETQISHLKQNQLNLQQQNSALLSQLQQLSKKIKNLQQLNAQLENDKQNNQTQKTLCSVKYLNNSHFEKRRKLTQQDHENRSFRRFQTQAKQTGKRQSINTNASKEDFYRFLLCQAATIQELV